MHHGAMAEETSVMDQSLITTCIGSCSAIHDWMRPVVASLDSAATISDVSN